MDQASEVGGVDGKPVSRISLPLPDYSGIQHLYDDGLTLGKIIIHR